MSSSPNRFHPNTIWRLLEASTEEEMKELEYVDHMLVAFSKAKYKRKDNPNNDNDSEIAPTLIPMSVQKSMMNKDSYAKKFDDIASQLTQTNISTKKTKHTVLKQGGNPTIPEV